MDRGFPEEHLEKHTQKTAEKEETLDDGWQDDDSEASVSSAGEFECEIPIFFEKEKKTKVAPSSWHREKGNHSPTVRQLLLCEAKVLADHRGSTL